jgi:hypothetical protein
MKISLVNPQVIYYSAAALARIVARGARSPQPHRSKSREQFGILKDAKYASTHGEACVCGTGVQFGAFDKLRWLTLIMDE